MPDIDISEIKEGDELTIRVFATGSVNNCAQTELWAINAMGDHPSEAFRINTHQITAHHPKPKPLAVGDRVSFRSGGASGEVKGVVGQYAWVKWDDAELPNTHTVKSLERVS